MLSLFKSLFGVTEVPLLEQAVLIHLKLTDDEFGGDEETFNLYSFEDALELLVNEAHVGEMDGHEFGGGYAVFFLYGSDANKLYSVVEKRVLEQPALPGSYLTKRFGPIGASQERIELLR